MSRGVVVSRTWQIIRLLESPKGCTLGELQITLGCSRRTVMRDLQGLQEAGLPIYDERDGREKRWKFVDGFTRQLPPPFTLSEIMALYFARALSKPLKGTPVHDPLDAAFRKIGSLLPPETKAMLDRLEKGFVSRTGPYKDYRRHRELLELVTRAQNQGRVLAVRYRSYARQETTERRISPYRLCYFRGGLYVIGHDDRRGEVRTFALERIQKAEATSERFQVPASFDFETYMESALGIFRGPEIRLRIAFRGTSAPAILERQWHPSQRIESRRDGTVVLSLQVADTLELRRWIMSFGAEAEVLEPVSLRTEIRDELQSLLDQLERWDLSPDQPFLPMLDLETNRN
ncbi:MAG: helix-turn-helix transcriptional regulator [Vicinamibacteria bacterium]